MKRRGFLKFMGAVPVAGPLAAKAVADDAMRMAGMSSLPSASHGLGVLGGSAGSIGMEAPDSRNWEKTRLQRLLKRSFEHREYERINTPVHALDADLIDCRSFSLSAKMRMQRDRNFQRSESREISNLEKAISGWFDL